MTIKRISRRRSRRRRVSRKRRVTRKRIVSRRRSHRSRRRTYRRRTYRNKRRTNRSKRRTKKKQKGGAGLALQGLGTGGSKTTDVGRAYMAQLGVDDAFKEAHVNWNTYLDAMREKISKSAIYHPIERIHHQREHHTATPNNDHCQSCRVLLTRLVSDTQTNQDHFKYDDVLFISDIIHKNKKHRVFEPSDISFLYDKLALATHFIHEKGDINHHNKVLQMQNALIGGTLGATGISFLDKGFTKKFITRWNTHRVSDKKARQLQTTVYNRQDKDNHP